MVALADLDDGEPPAEQVGRGELGVLARRGRRGDLVAVNVEAAAGEDTLGCFCGGEQQQAGSDAASDSEALGERTSGTREGARERTLRRHDSRRQGDLGQADGQLGPVDAQQAWVGRERVEDGAGVERLWVDGREEDVGLDEGLCEASLWRSARGGQLRALKRRARGGQADAPPWTSWVTSAASVRWAELAVGSA